MLHNVIFTLQSSASTLLLSFEQTELVDSHCATRAAAPSPQIPFCYGSGTGTNGQNPIAELFLWKHLMLCMIIADDYEKEVLSHSKVIVVDDH